MRDLDYVARLLARQQPAWPPGTRHGYHAMTIGLYMQELIRRVDPAHRTLGRFFQEEIAEPLGLDFYIGLPREIPDTRSRRSNPCPAARALLALGAFDARAHHEGALAGVAAPQVARDPADIDCERPTRLEVEVPAGNGVGTARAIARAYSAFAEGGAELGLTPETFARITAPPDVARRKDDVLGVPVVLLARLSPARARRLVRFERSARSVRRVRAARSASPIPTRASATRT